MLQRLNQLGLNPEQILEGLIRTTLLLVMAPSGVGKGSVIKSILALAPESFYLSVSATTRAPRSKNGITEVKGEHYHFMSIEEFKEREEAGEFTETAQFGGNWYGTLKSELLKADGRIVINELEVQGAEKTMSHFPGRKIILVVLFPPDEAVHLQRLEGRGTENKEQLLDRFASRYDELCRGLALGAEPICNQTGQTEVTAKKVIDYTTAYLQVLCESDKRKI